MPFTFSHPAVILPFRYIGKQYFSITGLVIGSIVPDFEYFLRMENRSRYSHTLPGVFYFDLPVAFLLCFLLHNLVKRPLITNMPYALHTRFIRYYNFNWNSFVRKKWIVVLTSILIGTFTHLIADRITHKSSNIVSSVPGLIEGHELIDSPNSIYRVIQITFSVIGLGLCFLSIWQLPPDKSVTYHKPDIRYWVVLCSIFSGVLFVIILQQGFDYVDFIVAAIAAMIASLLTTSLIPFPGKKLVLLKR